MAAMTPGRPTVDLSRRPLRHISERADRALAARVRDDLAADDGGHRRSCSSRRRGPSSRRCRPREFFLETNWQPLFEPVSYGVWELVAGTVNVVLWSLVFALPIGLAAAIYLSEYAHPNTRKVLKPILEALAGVPTVVYAYFALTVVTQQILSPWLGERHHLVLQQPRGDRSCWQ